MSILEKSATELIHELRVGNISAVDLLNITIEHAENIAESVNPFAFKLYERAQQAAIAADQQLAQGLGGPLCGLPITVKDSQWLAGVPCTNGSRTQQDFVPSETCEAVRRLEDAGAVIFAKTTCPEFSLTGVTTSELHGCTSNPWDISRTCGGSSGGAGAAVSAGAGSLSLGGDGGGSIRIPSALCGIVGFKPSFRAVPREPCFPSWSSLVSYGPMTRSVADARLMFSVIASNNDQHAYLDELKVNQQTNLQGQRIIVSEDLGFAPVDDDILDNFRRTISLLEAAGAEIIYDQPNLPSSVVAWATTAHYDSWSFQKQKHRPMEGLEKSTLAAMVFGSSLSEEEFQSAEQYRQTILDAYTAMFERAGTSIIITPTLGCEAFAHGQHFPPFIGSTAITEPWRDWASFLYDANLTGMPGCALPMGLNKNELPTSIHISGPVGSDISVLNIAEQLEALIGWNNAPKTPVKKIEASAETTDIELEMAATVA